ncbi:MAG: hypothetical protein WA061_02475 [Microgenomates group bacterium]
MEDLEYVFLMMKTEKLAEWWNIFNDWEYPKDFVFPKPDDWGTLLLWSKEDKTARTKYTISKPYVNAIMNVIGLKECLRWHHIHNLNMKNYQFELWWFAHKRFDVYTFMDWR